jgi:hypothetical protein
MEPGMPRLAAPLLAVAACWRSPAPPPPLRGEIPARAAVPPTRTTWTGTCGDEASGWGEEISITVTLRDTGTELAATGTLAFAGRRTRARLRGPRSDGRRHTLHGEMIEIGGAGTRWGLILEVEPGATALRGRFLEILDEGGQDEMCRFAWRR